MYYRLLVALLSFVPLTTIAQLSTSQQLENQVPRENLRKASEIIDSVYGITIYERLNVALDGDSLRNCKGYACQAWVEDFYEDGTMAHRGYYINGMLKVYKNFYPNGKLEREFKSIDNYRSLMRKYYADGTLKSEVKYVEGSAISWSDYFPDGKLEYHEEYHKSFNYHLKREKYNANGNQEEYFELVDKRKLIFDQKEYHASGKVKEAGQVHYDNEMFDFVRIGKWSFYGEDGSLKREEWYNKGTIQKEKDY